MADLNSHTLVRATPLQTLESRRLGYDSWKPDLSSKQREELDNLIYQEQNPADVDRVTWVLVPRDDPTTVDFKCSCETYRRQALVVVPKLGSKSQVQTDGPEPAKNPNTNSDQEFEVVETPSYGITAVFTRPEYRRRGYGKRMVSLLHWVLRDRDRLPDSEFPEEWGEMPPDSVAPWGGALSVLYSSVGEFYTSAGPKGGQDGWLMKEVNCTIWDVPPTSPDPLAQSNFKTENATSVRFLTESDIPRIWDLDAQWMKKDMLSRAKAFTTSTFHPLCAIPPSRSGASYPFTYEQNHMRFFGKGDDWNLCGAIVEGQHLLDLDPSDVSEEQSPSFVTWGPDLVSNNATPLKRLVLTRLRATPTTLPELLLAAFDVAQKLGLSAVETWNLDPALEDSSNAMGLKSRKERRKKLLGALKWYWGEYGTSAEGESDGSDDVEWMFNEKYAWC